MAARRGGKRRARYVFDTNVFHQFAHYYVPTFQPLWDLLDKYTTSGEVISVAEVRQEILRRNSSEHLLSWVKSNVAVFKDPTTDELLALKEIFKIKHFQQLVEQKERLTHGPSADGFVIAAAQYQGACVVSMETYKQNGAKIPNVCEKLGVECIKLAEFFERENWRLVEAPPPR